MEAGVCANETTDLGYSALHAATAGGWYDCINYLLQQGANVDMKSRQMNRALQIAKVNCFDSERHLRAHEWQLRAANKKKKENRLINAPLMQHQMFDSHSCTWIDGEYGTRYMCTSKCPVDEFSGSRINAPTRLPPKTPQNRKKYRLVPIMHVPDIDKNTVAKNDTTYRNSMTVEDISFCDWVNNKKLERKTARRTTLQMEAELAKAKEAEEEENNNHRRAMKFYHEQKKREARLNEEKSERTNTKMYEDRNNMPKYQMSIVRQYMNSLLLTNE